MQLTTEQQSAVMDGAERHDNAIRNAINGAQHAADESEVDAIVAEVCNEIGIDHE